MKKIFYLLLFNTVLSLRAQVPSLPPAEPLMPPAAPEAPAELSQRSNTDTVKIKLGDRDILIIEKEKVNKDNDEAIADLDEPSKKENKSPIKKKKSKSVDVDFIDIETGVTYLLAESSVNGDLENDLENKPFKSWNTSLNFASTKIYLGSRNLILMTALGWHFQGLRFKNKLTFEPNKTLAYKKDDNVKFFEFHTQYIQIPVSLYLQSNKIKGLGRIGIGGGVYGGLLIHQNSKEAKSNLSQWVTTHEDYGFNKFRYGINGKLDIGALKFYMNYDLSDTWKDQAFRTLECGLWLDF